MKFKLSENQLKILAEIFEKIGLAFGIAVFINGFVIDKATISLLEGIIFIVIAIITLTLSIVMRK